MNANMQILTEEEDYIVVLAPQSRLRRALKWIVSMDTFTMTYRFPLMKKARITLAEELAGKSTAIAEVLQHEVHHVEQFKPWWGPIYVLALVLLFPLPVLFSGRWFIERQAYLDDIRAGHDTVDDVVTNLWRYYWWAWPKPLMRRWFLSKLNA